MKMHKLLMIIIGILFLIFLSWLFKTLIFGQKESGFINDLTELPRVGKHLQGFQTQGKIKFNSKKLYLGGFSYSVVFTGYTSEKALKSFCREDERWRYEFSTEPSKLFKCRIEDIGLGTSEFPTGLLEEDTFVHYVSNEGPFTLIEMSFRKSDGKFTGYAYYTDRGR